MKTPVPSTAPRYRYPCTGRTNTVGFAEYLAENLTGSRSNLHAFAEELGCTFNAPHLTLVNSGSSANLAAALALAEEIRERDGGDTDNNGPMEAITAGFTFPTTLTALQTAGFRVRVADTEPGGFCLSPDALREAITPQTRLVCVTHFLGFSAQLAQIVSIARENNLLVLQDACETMELPVGGKPAHKWGDLTTWSFYHPHHLSAFGGGAVVSPHAARRVRVESIAHWGRACTCHFDKASCPAPPGHNHNFWYVREGHNLELSELNASFGRFQLQTWPIQEAARLRHYDTLFDHLNGLQTVEVYPRPKNGGSPFVFPITLQNGKTVDDIAPRFARREVEIRTLMGGGITRQPAYLHLHHADLPHCDDMAARSFFVGIHQTLPDADVETVAQILREELVQL